jgi:lipopolysaccharide/colanic/teichoic acid biosynthesis glycosyltransferase
MNALTTGSLSTAEEIREIVGGGWIEELQIVPPASAEAVRRVVEAGREAGRPVRLLGDVAASELPPARKGERWVWQRFHGQQSWLLRSARPALWARVGKRMVDIVVSLGLLVLLSPLLAALAVAVRLSSPGPIFYRWRVLGRNGRPFTGFKFRTMVRDADSLKLSLLEHNQMVGPVFKVADDPRVTSVGRWLRRYSLDEVPQLWNVLKGDMSLVGPRPVFREEYVRFELWQMRKLSVTPGVTCLWQVQGRNSIRDFSDWAKLDLQYIDEWSLALDAKILARTVQAVARGTGL